MNGGWVAAHQGLGLPALSRLWGRDFNRVVRAHLGANVTAELSDGQDRRSYLRLYRRPGWSAREIGFELDVLRAVAPQPGMAVAAPLAGRGGVLLHQLAWNGTLRHACLFEAAPGRPLLHRPEDVRRFGRGLALLHTAMRMPASAAPRRIEATSSARLACRWLSRVGGRAAALGREIAAATPHLARVLALHRPTVGPCHGDACLLNASLDGERVTFFDFEECGVGPLALDLATMAVWLDAEPDGAALRTALLDGYASRRALPAADLAALPALALLAEIRRSHVLARFYRMPDELWQSLHGRLTERMRRL